MRGRFLRVLILAALGGAASIVNAELSGNAQVFASGFDNPRGLAFHPNTSLLYVAEAGLGGYTSTSELCGQVPAPLGPITGDYSGRISVVDETGTRTTAVNGLPSSQSQDYSILGPADIEFVRGRMRILIAAGCSKGHIDFPNAIARLFGPNIEILADLSDYNLNNPQNFPPDEDEDPEGNPYSFKATSEGMLLVVEANHSTVDLVAPDGSISRVADMAEYSQGYDTPVAIDVDLQNNIYVGSFGEFPFAQNTSNVYKITPNGTISIHAQGFTSLIDIAFSPQGELYILETSTGNTGEYPFLFRDSGRLSRLNRDGSVEEIASGLDLPTALTFGPDGAIYISNRGHGMGIEAGLGEIVRVDISAF